MLKCVMYTSDNPPQYLASYLVEFSKVAEEQQVPWDFNETSSSFFFSGGCGVWTISLRHDGWFVFCVFFVYIMCLVCRGWSTKPWESLSTSINQLGSWRFLVIVEFVHSSGDRSDRWLPCGCSRVTSWTWRMDMYGGDDRGNEDKEDDDGRKMVVMMIMIMFEN